MKRAALTALLILTLGASSTADEEVRGAIVKVYTTYQRPSGSRPWQMAGQGQRTGSGCVIEGQRVLTNAHVVSDRTFIQVRRAGKSEKYVAQVEAVSHELDLALLSVPDAGFFEGSRPLPLGDLPRVGDRVTAYGFPTGGTRITITKGVVSRIDRQTYSHSDHRNLVCQIDAAINSGSSGGPVVSDGEIVGVAFQTSRGQNIGYMVPAPVVRHFFSDLEDGRHDGTPTLFVTWQLMENPQLRQFYAMSKEQSGILLNQVTPHFAGSELLLPGDVLLSVDGSDIANDGTIAFRPQERIGWGYAVDRKQVNDKLRLEVLRKGKIHTIEAFLGVSKRSYGYLVPRKQYETRPTYFIVGGLVFSPLTTNYMLVWDKWTDVPLRVKRYYYEIANPQNASRKQVVVLIDVLPDELNVSYTGLEDWVVSNVNGISVNSMQDLVRAFEEHQGDSHRIVFETFDREIVLMREQLTERGAAILKKYQVPADRSPDLR